MNRLTIAFLLGSLAVSIGCKKPPPPAAPVAAGPPAAAKPMPAQIPPVLARVNGEAINKWEFDDAVRRIEAMAGSPVPPDRRDEVLRGALDQLVAYHLIAQESRARKMGPTDADVDARIAKIKGNFPNDDAFQKGIAAQGLTVDDLPRPGQAQPRSGPLSRRRSQLEDRRHRRRGRRVLQAEPGSVQAGRGRACASHPDRRAGRTRAPPIGPRRGQTARSVVETAEARREIRGHRTGNCRPTPAARRTAATSASFRRGK